MSGSDCCRWFFARLAFLARSGNAHEASSAHRITSRRRGEDIVGYGPGYERSPQFGLGYLRLARPLEPGFVLTVEPGLYFIPALIDQWKAEGTNAAFINFAEVEKFRDARGCRIEDDVLVTATGGRVLGPAIPKTIAEVEAACRA